MTGPDDTMELEFSEEDVAYFIVDEHDNEIGIALFGEDGETVEYLYAEDEEGFGLNLSDGGIDDDASAEAVEGSFELEFSEEDVAYYIVDIDGNELGFALMEKDGTNTEYYYEGVDPDAFEPLGSSDATATQTLAEKAGAEIGKLASRTQAGAKQAAEAAKDTVRKIADGEDPQEDSDSLGFGLSKSGVKKAAGDFSVFAKESAATVAEIREAYDDIFGQLDFPKPSSPNRKRRYI